MTKSFTLNKVLSGADFTMGVATSSFQIEGASELREPCIVLMGGQPAIIIIYGSRILL